MRESTEEKLRKLAPLGKGRGDKGWLLYLSGEGEERSHASELVDVLLFQKLAKDYRKRILLDPPHPSLCYGKYVLGTVRYPPEKTYCGFGMREDDWIKHMLIVGMTGTGKTNLVFHMLREFQKNKKPFMVFDWKRNYRDLRQLPEFKELRVYRPGGDVEPFKFNPVIPPPGTAPGEWLMKLVDVIKHAYFVGEGVEYLLREAIDTVYDECGFYDESSTGTPTFLLVRYRVLKKRAQGRMQLWKASAVRVFESLCFRHGLGPVVNTDSALDEQLLNAPAVLELDVLSDVDKVFLTEAVILWLYEFRKHEGNREVFKHALVIEEGHHVLSRRKERAEGAETILETSLRQIREFGEAVVVIDQEPTKLSNSIKANTYCKIVFNLGNGDDVDDMARCLNLDDEERGYIDLLEVGEAVVALKGRVRCPLHVAFPKVEVGKGLVQNRS